MIDKTVLITRPQGDEETLARLLHARGCRVIHEPMTQIVRREDMQQALTQALAAEPDAVVVTSRHGAQALAQLTPQRDMFLVCVGPATAETAQALGFARLSVAGGNSGALRAHIRESYDPGSKLLYVSGAHIAANLDAALHEDGMRVLRLPIYEARASQQLSDTLQALLLRRQVHIATFLSPRAGQIFSALARKADILPALSHLHACCLSEAVAQSLPPGDWKSVSWAHEPTLASVAQCVDTACQTSTGP